MAADPRNCMSSMLLSWRAESASIPPFIFLSRWNRNPGATRFTRLPRMKAKRNRGSLTARNSVSLAPTVKY